MDGGRGTTQARTRKVQQADPFSFLFQNNPLPMWIYDLETLRFLEVNAFGGILARDRS